MGYKMSYMKEAKRRLTKEKIKKIIKEEIKNHSCLNEQITPTSVNWNGSQYQYYHCEAGNPTTTANTAQGWTCPDARLVRSKNCDPADTQNYYLVTEILMLDYMIKKSMHPLNFFKSCTQTSISQ